MPSLLAGILQFVTGLDEELPLGFEFPPSIHFVAAPQNVKWSFIPTANACSGTMVLPRGSYDLSLPAEEERSSLKFMTLHLSTSILDSHKASLLLTFGCKHEAGLKQSNLRKHLKWLKKNNII